VGNQDKKVVIKNPLYIFKLGINLKANYLKIKYSLKNKVRLYFIFTFAYAIKRIY